METVLVCIISLSPSSVNRLCVCMISTFLLKTARGNGLSVSASFHDSLICRLLTSPGDHHDVILADRNLALVKHYGTWDEYQQERLRGSGVRVLESPGGSAGMAANEWLRVPEVVYGALKMAIKRDRKSDEGQTMRPSSLTSPLIRSDFTFYLLLAVGDIMAENHQQSPEGDKLVFLNLQQRFNTQGSYTRHKLD